MSSLRPDLWPSRASAETSIRNAKVFKSWDRRFLERYIAHAFRETPTALYPSGKATEGSVTLTTTKHQESWSYVRDAFDPVADPATERLLRPDLDAEKEGVYLFTRPECAITLRNLPFVRPAVLYIYGAKSPFAAPELVEEKMQTTGTGVGGSGGVEAGKVEKEVFEGVGHFVPCERPREICERGAEWIGRVLEGYVGDETFLRGKARRKSTRGMLEASGEWVENVKKAGDARRVGAKL